MANYHKICVFDFETDGSNPECCSPVQIAALMIDPKKLEVIPDSEFNISLFIPNRKLIKVFFNF